MTVVVRGLRPRRAPDAGHRRWREPRAAPRSSIVRTPRAGPNDRRGLGRDGRPRLDHAVVDRAVGPREERQYQCGEDDEDPHRDAVSDRRGTCPGTHRVPPASRPVPIVVRQPRRRGGRGHGIGVTSGTIPPNRRSFRSAILLSVRFGDGGDVGTEGSDQIATAHVHVDAVRAAADRDAFQPRRSRRRRSPATRARNRTA